MAESVAITQGVGVWKLIILKQVLCQLSKIFHLLYFLHDLKFLAIADFESLDPLLENTKHDSGRGRVFSLELSIEELEHLFVLDVSNIPLEQFVVEQSTVVVLA